MPACPTARRSVGTASLAPLRPRVSSPSRCACVVGCYAAVAQFAAATFGSDQPGDGAFDHGPVLSVGGAQVGAFGPVTAGVAQQGVVLVEVEGAAVLGGGAAAPQRAAAAGDAEDHPTVASHCAGDAVRAGDGTGGLVHGEVVGAEPALDSRPQGCGFDDCGVAGVAERSAGLAGAVGVVTEHLEPAGDIGGVVVQQRQTHDSLVVVLTAGLGQFPGGEQPRGRLDGHLALVAVLTPVDGL